jgi:phage gp36-like protein
MGYCTQADIETLYSRELVDLLGDSNGDGTADNSKIQAAIDAAGGIIDAYLTTKYTLPIANPPQILKQLCIDIVVYRLALFPVSRTDEMRQRYEDAISFLKQLASGTAALPLSNIVDPDGETGPIEPTPVTQPGFRTRILNNMR